MRTWTRGFPSQDCSWFGIGGGPAVHNEWTRGFPSQGYPWFGLVRLLLTVTGNPAIHASMDPWLSVPGLPLVWQLEAARLSTQLWTRGFLSQGYPWFSDWLATRLSMRTWTRGFPSQGYPWFGVLVTLLPPYPISGERERIWHSRLVKDRTVSLEHTVVHYGNRHIRRET